METLRVYGTLAMSEQEDERRPLRIATCSSLRRLLCSIRAGIEPPHGPPTKMTACVLAGHANFQCKPRVYVDGVAPLSPPTGPWMHPGLPKTLRNKCVVLQPANLFGSNPLVGSQPNPETFAVA
ncbi:hypothetical protein Ae201684_003989 [Aphanomyces euteiches]|uniref:Uncharacterized protein n=1 Tax=Aphanomyces euteiches TaxID=100861 RepID=A0A6G0XKA0_9STRA|nr:hypothetical protein Ae201684_003989 [Aphanomyces euteiches]